MGCIVVPSRCPVVYLERSWATVQSSPSDLDSAVALLCGQIPPCLASVSLSVVRTGRGGGVHHRAVLSTCVKAGT